MTDKPFNIRRNELIRLFDNELVELTKRQMNAFDNPVVSKMFRDKIEQTEEMKIRAVAWLEREFGEK